MESGLPIASLTKLKTFPIVDNENNNKGHTFMKAMN